MIIKNLKSFKEISLNIYKTNLKLFIKSFTNVQNMQDPKFILKEVPSSFKDLKISTKTIMVYTNICVNMEQIFQNLKITEVSVPVTKKKKLPNMKKLVAPKYAIVSVRYKNQFRGIVTKPSVVNSNQSSKYFLNQVTCILSLGQKNLNIMIFKNKFKIAGCREFAHAVEAIRVLWEKIKKIPESYQIVNEVFIDENIKDVEYTKIRAFLQSIKEDKMLPEDYEKVSDFLSKTKIKYLKYENPPTNIFDTVMTNVDFKLGFIIDRKKLNNIMNKKEYKSFIKISNFEPTGHTNINIKMYCKEPSNFTYKTLIIPSVKGTNPYFEKRKENPYDTKEIFMVNGKPFFKDKKDKKDKGKYTTFLVFRSSKVIESGRYMESMSEAYTNFIKIIKDSVGNIEEEIRDNEEVYKHEK